MRNQKGITLIALVITIIVLLILAGVSIAMLSGENGILTNATEAQKDTDAANAVEKINIALQAIKTEALAKSVDNNAYKAATDTTIISADVTSIISEKEAEANGYHVTQDTTSGKIEIIYKNTNTNVNVSGSITFTEDKPYGDVVSAVMPADA